MDNLQTLESFLACGAVMKMSSAIETWICNK